MKNRLVAALLALFVGCFGIHKFYLGENLAGIFYLIFSWTFIPSIIAFFEFLGLVLMSDQAFNAKFNYQYITSSQTRFEESSRDKAATLIELKRLYDQGIITAEEFEEKRRKILDSI
ncbi:NINE protein [Crocosphaera sp. UHCC 0190]|uniref:NINE protein n=1 Tax=Crocosphaera sp. UHCC 0190 TaxID=3110246 RepID=UPI002B20C48A|nr:NINE protein [Crocosphaera sp. UHCC 0190]MEA5510705.1 NINE protein [Crocosphaera sp. UHCC 0190]